MTAVLGASSRLCQTVGVTFCANELLGAVSSLENQVDSAFADPRFSLTIEAFSDAQVCIECGKATSFTFVSTRSVPFAMDALGAAIWRFLCGSKQKPHRQIVLNGDSMTKTFRGPYDSQIHVQGKMVVRCIVQADRILILSATNVVPVNLFAAGTSIPILQHRTCRVIRNPQLGAMALRTADISQLHLHQTITVTDVDLSGILYQREPMSEFIVRTFHGKLAAAQQKIDSILLERERASRVPIGCN